MKIPNSINWQLYDDYGRFHFEIKSYLLFVTLGSFSLRGGLICWCVCICSCRSCSDGGGGGSWGRRCRVCCVVGCLL